MTTLTPGANPVTFIMENGFKTFYNKNEYQIYDFQTPLNKIKNIPQSIVLEENENYVKPKSKKTDESKDIKPKEDTDIAFFGLGYYFAIINK